MGFKSGSIWNKAGLVQTSALSIATKIGISPKIWTLREFAYALSESHCRKELKLVPRLGLDFVTQLRIL